MKNNYSLKALLCYALFLFATTTSFSQTKEQIQEITKTYNLEKLNTLKLRFQKKALAEKTEAVKLARQNGWPIRYTDEKGTLFELQKVSKLGSPIYFKTFNVAAATSTRANYLHNGGGLGLNIEGQGMTAYIWDGGLARETHQEYDGIGGNNRYINGDGSTALHFHAAHVTGTIIASGFQAVAKGMAPQAQGIGSDWNDDIAEATIATTNGMLLSNHSYGYNATAIDDWFFGAYGSDAQEWDELMYNAPYYLMVVAAGNDGGNDTANGNPLNGQSAYDKLSGHATAKNNLVVANGQDATINANGTLNSVNRNSSSSEGPTDDLRIKPDIMGNGTQLYSTYETSDTAYNSITGTSMASPNVCGSLLLLQQHYNTTNGVFMKAATLKGLALHTADDAGINGPDAKFGWGLMNTKVAAETISNNGFQSWVSEETLTNGGSFTMTVQSDGANPLLASISWTDQAGVENTGTPNDPTAALVNDLDIKVTQGGTTNDAWKLTGVNSNTTGDNTVDPFERVDIAGASGTYTITVTHKGVLASGSQNFSIILTGLSSAFALSTTAATQTICTPTDAVFNFDYEQIGAGTTNFSTTGTPAGATVNFSPASRNSNGSFDVTFSNLINVTAGEYNVGIIGNNGTETETRNVLLKVLHPDFTAYPQTLTAPANGSIVMATSATLNWATNTNAEDYLVDVSTDANFNTIVDTNTVNTTSYVVSGLLNETVYYWRVRPDNNCANGNVSETYNFQTGSKTCATEDRLTPAQINDQATGTSILNFTNAYTIGDVNIRVNYDHTWIGDVALTLISPAGTRVTLIEVVTCTTQTNFNINFDSDATNVIDCNLADTNYPAISTYQPIESLTAFNGEASNGSWTLEIVDGGPGDTGTVNNWSLEICEYNQTGTVPNFANNGLNVDTSSTYTTISGDIEATTASETAIQQIYTVTVLPTIGTLLKNGTAVSVGDTFTQDDVNTSKISYSNTETAAYTNQFKVDILNASNGWLPNQTVPINATVLSINEFDLGALAIWPNPTNSIINIQINNATSETVFIKLFDIQGRNVLHTKIDSNSSQFNTRVNTNSIANGMYLLSVQQGSKQTFKRIIINK